MLETVLEGSYKHPDNVKRSGQALLTDFHLRNFIIYHKLFSFLQNKPNEHNTKR